MLQELRQYFSYDRYCWMMALCKWTPKSEDKLSNGTWIGFCMMTASRTEKMAAVPRWKWMIVISLQLKNGLGLIKCIYWSSELQVYTGTPPRKLGCVLLVKRWPPNLWDWYVYGRISTWWYHASSSTPHSRRNVTVMQCSSFTSPIRCTLDLSSSIHSALDSRTPMNIVICSAWPTREICIDLTIFSTTTNHELDWMHTNEWYCITALFSLIIS